MTTQSPIIGTSDILVLLNVSEATFYRLFHKDPTFPKAFKIGLRKKAWFRANVEAWINARAGVAA